MIEEKRIYDQMWSNFGQVMEAGRYQTDSLIDDQNDNRRGITTLSYLRHSVSLVNEVSNFLQRMKVLEPEQYYPPISDLHLTILTIITCFDNFQLSENEEIDYAELFREAVKGIPPLQIQFKGITASPSCVLLQGFMPNEQLADLREKLRVALDKSHLHISRDSRYNIATAHSTIVRFKEPFRDSNKLFELLKDYREFDFGTHTVDRVELVFNDWYVKEIHTKQLAEVYLA